MATAWSIERTREVLGACCVLALGLVLLWFVMYLVAADLIFGVHSSLFDIDRATFELTVYCGLALVKILAFVFFLIPYVALKITGK